MSPTTRRFPQPQLRNNTSSTYTFSRSTRPRSLAMDFLAYIVNTLNNGGRPTRRGFLYQREYQVSRGYLSEFFAAVRRAGIVRVTGKTSSGEYIYGLGFNAHNLLDGNTYPIGWMMRCGRR